MATKLEKQIIKRMDGKTTFGKIGQEFGLSYQTIKTIAEANGIKRPASNKRQKQTIEDRALTLLEDTTLTRVKIAYKLGIGVEALRKITKKHDIRKTRALTARNEEITKLIKAGTPYPEIAKQYNITKQRVYQFGKIAGYSRNSELREVRATFTKNVKADVKAGMSYSDIQKKYELKKNGYKLAGSEISNLATQFRSKRDNGLVKEYKTKSAVNVIKSNRKELINPNKVNTVDGIYRIATKSGFKKYPQIGNRSKGGVFEDNKVIKFIKTKRENGLSFSDITTLLNAKGFKTIMGKEFTTSNVNAKFKAIVKHNA